MAPPPPNQPQYPTPQHLQQFLSTALSQRGPASLPYTEDSKLLIRSHLISLFSSYPSLFPKSSVFTHNDGRSVNLLKADDTVPISYLGHSYNIPASIWLLESYPRHPPLVFLTPTPNMSVKVNHPYVDQNCSVHVPYLHSWIFPSSNLVDLVKSMSHLFSQDPPLYTRQPNPNPSPRPPPSVVVQHQQQQQQQWPAPTPVDPADVYMRKAINNILESVHGDMVAVRKAQEAEMEGLFGTQAELRKREQEIMRGVREMVEEKEGLEQQLQVVLMNSDVLESWVRENEGKRRPRDLDADDVFEPVDDISKQMLECTAADLAVDDVVYSLDKAVQEGAIPFEMYLKSMRALSREQFFHRALAVKVRASQVQAQVAGMASRVPSMNYAS